MVACHQYKEHPFKCEEKHCLIEVGGEDRMEKKRLRAILILSMAFFFSSIVFATNPTAGAVYQDYRCNNGDIKCQAEMEFLLDSEIHKEFLQSQTTFLGQNFFDKNRPVCNTGRGESYGNGKCYPPRSGYQYHRPCSKIYGCHS